MPDFQPISEVMHLFFSFLKHVLPYWSWFFATSCRIQCLPLELGQFLTMLQAQSLPWDLNPQLWLNWCPDMPHQTQLLSVQLLIRGNLHP
jgi:hypothetical protein